MITDLDVIVPLSSLLVEINIIDLDSPRESPRELLRFPLLVGPGPTCNHIRGTLYGSWMVNASTKTNKQSVAAAIFPSACPYLPPPVLATPSGPHPLHILLFPTLVIVVPHPSDTALRLLLLGARPREVDTGHWWHAASDA